ncbi:hypothetical protein EUTSA_v10004309mg [Eutrema salsugineum]|uniref:FBD domain-containing protein n=1 Tax=Eutrema salsugineum TaxID=72664 RepID=V4MJM7_EUTSA|nr:FBD-associated F-box protein At4g10400 [Eutrema salsugineum]XP_024007097.1 FBD-associated F-box protein At4g10400 [Eutrema salsugineum]ESQ31566.1 hypothetical protein EUTSA_v10004309mg [Eutrema salsugineum]
MDRISELSDELLVRILSFLPTKVAVSTSILSKRWECLWMWLPKLDFVSSHCTRSECESLRCLLDRSLPLYRASVMESFRLDLSFSRYKPEDVKLWVVIAVSRCLRELDIVYDSYLDKQCILPSSLYACKSLVVLKLEGDILLDVPRRVCLPSLKTLQLRNGTGLDGESLKRLLSICPVLENLSVDFCHRDDNVGKIIVIVMSLQSLSLSIPRECYLDGLEIDTPSLKYLKLEDLNDENESCVIEDMPKLEEAYIHVRFPDIKSIIGSITSVKRLTLCSQVLYGNGFVFNQLEYLKLCVCTRCSSNLLARLLKDSPNLRVLNIFQILGRASKMVSWNRPSTVPACFWSTIQTFIWSGYMGRPQEKDVAVYVLENAHRLYTARISSDEKFIPKFEMLKELSVCSRASTTCRLFFD